jgi:lipoprotein NlpD
MILLRGCYIVVVLLLLWGCSAPRGVYHTVQNGQTLYQISKSYQIDEIYLAKVNNISDPTRLAVGQRIFIPGVVKTHHVPATVPAKATATKSVVKSTPSRESSPKPVPAPAKTTASTVKTSKPVTRTATSSPSPTKKPVVKKGIFIWPLRGKVVRSFGGSGSKSSNGIEISASNGAIVTSAAAGKVIYSGNGISGYGNLIILQHDDTFYSVYGFNQKNLVDAGGFVSKGQKIALCGVPPSGGTPRLYFEVRHGKQPVNPIFYLP